MRTSLVYPAVLISLCVVRAPQGTPLLLGVLDQRQCGKDSTLGVRTLFRKEGSAWIPLTTGAAARLRPGAEFRWTVAFDGRTLGSLTTSEPPGTIEPTWYPRDHRQRIVVGSSVPRVASRGHRFEGWCDAPSARPLVVVTQPNSADPQHWKPFTPDSSARLALFAHFRKVVDTVYACTSPEDQGRRWQYHEGDLVFGRSYADSSGRQLVALELNPAAQKCDGPPGPAWSLHWFYVATDTAYLGAEMELLDAGDYDGHGESEVLFWHSGYNEDGYTLFYDGLRRQARFWWQYQ